MAQWQYMQTSVDRFSSDEAVSQHLNDMDATGWELVATDLTIKGSTYGSSTESKQFIWRKPR
ncbi:hypothetical protein BIV57_00680 [Mangrovactinospora gilvigrisea]|uniref:DUF4177 domain-containing protein n=1 Tax=Mangrovactinospora gilvigrisea TaxID=1428644 RepID=A0A1J7CCW5_9ACTN|nr:hypothetical protein [Mangrovactinospora gilvigrisea]OIV39392.1 hypothetical protein BIV57_00680 [Mangrovactinospora gilvigrisea]